ncbi:restriction endonuclease subunit S [Amylibacter sp.]|nr:restriction endonuclease subunit S [Amylibacter sp.]
MSKKVPEGWEETNLSTLVSVDIESLKGNTDPEYKFKYIDISCVSTGSVTPPSQHILFQNAPSRAKRIVKKNDVLIATVRPNLKAFAHFDEEGEDWVASTGFAVLRNKEWADSRFIFNVMLADDVSWQIDKLVAGSNYPAINSSDVKDLTVLSPPLPEQKKIASILTSVDKVIETIQKQINKLQDLKKATMNELLTKGIGHTEFKDSELGRIPKSWEVSIVRNSIENITSGWSPDCLPDPAVGSQWGVLKTTAVTWNGFDKTENKALPSHLDGRIQISLKAGDVLITRAGPIDRVGVVAFCNETYPKIMLSDKVIRIQSKSDELMGEFLSIWLGSYAAQQNMRSKISGMAEAQSNISQDILKSIPVPLPNLSVQKQIVQILRSVDMRIKVQKNKLSQTQSLKKSLMQDLLTGKVRVKVN